MPRQRLDTENWVLLATQAKVQESIQTLTQQGQAQRSKYFDSSHACPLSLILRTCTVSIVKTMLNFRSFTKYLLQGQIDGMCDI